MDRDDVGALDQLVKGLGDDAVFLHHLGVTEGIVGPDVVTEGSELSDDGLSDAAKADNSNHLVAQTVDLFGLAIPVAAGHIPAVCK